MGMFKKDEVDTIPSQTYIKSESSEISVSVIGKSLYVKGEVTSDEEVLIEGKIEGKIKSNHRVIIGKDGTVNADIVAKEVIIKGSVTGNVTCSYKIEIVPDGKLTGNIVSNKVVLAEGAIFKGNIDMAADEKKIIPDSEEVVEAEVIENAEATAGKDAEEISGEKPGKKKK